MSFKRVVALATMTIATAFGSNALAHARLEASSPKAGAVVGTAPREVRLQFNERVEPAFSKIKLVDQTGKIVEAAKVDLDKSDPRVMIATVPVLGSGRYRVQWTALTRDGHKVKGEFPFQVK